MYFERAHEVAVVAELAGGLLALKLRAQAKLSVGREQAALRWHQSVLKTLELLQCHAQVATSVLVVQFFKRGAKGNDGALEKNA